MVYTIHLLILSSPHLLILSSPHLLILSSPHPLIFSSHHLLILSSSHPPLQYLHVLMALQRHPPRRVFQHVVDEAAHDDIATVPVGLEEEETAPVDFLGVRLGPCKVLFAADDDLEFVGFGEDVGFRGGAVLRGEADPVPVSKRYGCFLCSKFCRLKHYRILHSVQDDAVNLLNLHIFKYLHRYLLPKALYLLSLRP